MAEIVERIELPHVVYPRGPARRIKTYRTEQDAIAGDILIAQLDVCGHEVTIVDARGRYTMVDDADIMTEALIRCPICHYEAHKETATILDPVPVEETADAR